MKAAHSAETLVRIYQSTRHHIPVNCNLDGYSYLKQYRIV